MSRGQITEEVQEKAKEFLHREISLKELRLYPYIDYCLKNFHTLDSNKINSDESDILAQLVSEGHVTWGADLIYAERPFYDFLQDILYITYVEPK